ncbi:nuclease-related domain-containing protein [Arsukibacterium indicum]|uniref:NERD domain-containing protein n=1 Tax=Arsukibacterium indicum TaxID=2848612 RepID=A0ABS6MJV5_9GAMM|nr:nuclease-related domain-containing protein [Arsukibacterium indicum]MBV2129114.1 NERD domain-containing protein [Arsukibacterium indicum]
MRWVRYFLPLLLLTAVQASGQQRYSEGACILLDQQVQRFSHMPQSSSYRNAKSEYDKNCNRPQRPVPPKPVPQQAEPVVVKPAEPEPQQQITPAETTEPSQLKPADTATDLAQPETSPPAVPVASPAVVAEELLQADATDDVATEPEQQPAAANSNSLPQPMLPVPVIIPTDDSTLPADWWRPANLINLMLANLPLIIANIFAFLLAVFLVTNWLGLNLPGFKGIFAEYKLNRLLRWRLARGYRHFRKLKLLTAKEELVVVDHLVLSPFGIFVIMVKGYRGSIFGEVAEANWLRQYFGTKKQFMNPLHQNFKHVEAIKHHLELQGTPLAQHVHSVIAFSRLAQFKTEMPANVTYLDTAPAYLKKFEEPCFDDEQLNRFAALLRQASTAN